MPNCCAQLWTVTGFAEAACGALASAAGGLEQPPCPYRSCVLESASMAATVCACWAPAPGDMPSQAVPDSDMCAPAAQQAVTTAWAGDEPGMGMAINKAAALLWLLWWRV